MMNVITRSFPMLPMSRDFCGQAACSPEVRRRGGLASSRLARVKAFSVLPRGGRWSGRMRSEQGVVVCYRRRYIMFLFRKLFGDCKTLRHVVVEGSDVGREAT
jgi:hypothetical protein